MGVKENEEKKQKDRMGLAYMNTIILRDQQMVTFQKDDQKLKAKRSEEFSQFPFHVQTTQDTIKSTEMLKVW